MKVSIKKIVLHRIQKQIFKNMRKLILGLAVVTALFSENANAQETKENGFYVKVNGGYNFAISNTQIVDGMFFDYTNETEHSSGSNIELVDINLGKGINFGASFGYMFNKNIGAEIGIDYLMGSKTKTRKNFLDGDYEKAAISSNMIQIKPTFILTAGYAKVNPYAKFGAIIGSGKITEKYTEYDSDLTEAEIESKGGLAFGFHAGVGVNYSFNSKFSLFGELNMNNLTYAPEEGKITKYDENGIDQLPSFQVRDREIDYVDHVNTGDPIDPNKPQKQPKNSFAYGTLGINVGLKYNF